MASDKSGPAFPFVPNEQQMLPNGTWDQNTDFGDPGLTKRELFAGLAMMGVLANHDLLTATCKRTTIEAPGDYTGTLALCSIGIADALLAELGKETQ